MQALGEKLPHRQVTPNAQSEAWKFRVDKLKEERQARAQSAGSAPHDRTPSGSFPHIPAYFPAYSPELRSRYQDAQALVCDAATSAF
jgi:hypothetical protein